MRQNPSFALTDPAELRRLVRENPWATFVSSTSLKVNGVSLANVPPGSYALTVVNPGPHASGSVQLTIQ